MINWRILRALIRKETYQIIRDPSAILIAFVLPLILLFIFGYGVNLDSNRVPIGLVVEKSDVTTSSLITAFKGTRFLSIELAQDRREVIPGIISGKLRGMVVVPAQFSADFKNPYRQAEIQTIADGTEPNTAQFVTNYSAGIVGNWLTSLQAQSGSNEAVGAHLESRFWYNPELKSRNFLIPGSIAIVMTLIGTLLTALVIAREWERGTMEAMLATPVTNKEILLGKLIPYFILGLGSMFLCLSISYFWYGVPFRGGLLVLSLVTGVFLMAGLGQGMLISTVARDQFVASQGALISAFLPAFMLSGFIFEISAMPQPIQWLTHIVAARYFVTSLQTIFMVGDVWWLLFKCIVAMSLIATFFYIIISHKTTKRLD
jgi:ABC-2 type transport system permease protein